MFRNRLLVALFVLIWIGLGLGLEHGSEASSNSPTQRVVMGRPSVTSVTDCGWSPSTAYPAPTSLHSGAVVGGSLYSFGGLANDLATAAAYRFDGATWTPTAPLPEALWGGTAVSDGSFIYILGGANEENLLMNVVYRYEPLGNFYTVLPGLPTPRALHTAAYLNGKIHVWGGTTDGLGPASDSHVVFDTVTLAWTDAASVPAPASYATSFVHGGYIYSVGGIPDWFASTATATTLRYDPSTNEWSDAAMADLPQPRMNSIGSSEAFQGQLMLVGGNETSAVSWDPTSNAWNPLSSPSIPHSAGIGGVIGDTFYVSSGTSTEKLTCTAGPPPTPEVFIDFGDQPIAVTSASQSIILVNGSDTEIIMGTPTFVDGTQFALVSDPNGTIVGPGGEISVGFTFTPALMGPQTDTVTIQSTAGSGPVIGLTGNGVESGPTPTPTPGCGWSPAASYPANTNSHTSAVLGGTLYSFGGITDNLPTAASYKFNGTAWMPIAPLPQPLWGASAVSDGSSIYIFGGVNQDNFLQLTVYIYNAEGDFYEMSHFPMPASRAFHSAAFFNNKFHVWGGTTDGLGPASESHLVFDKVSAVWTDAAPVPAPAAFATAFVHNGYIYSVGGSPDFAAATPTAKTLRYDPATNVWNDAAMADLPQATMSAIGSTGSFQGQLVVVGGSSADARAWDPTSNMWNPLPLPSFIHNEGIGGVINDTFYVSSGTSTEKYACTGGTTPTPSPSGNREIAFVGGTSPATGGQVLTSVTIAAQGDENGVGFSLDYDTALLSDPVVSLGSNFPDAALFVNTDTAGRIGVIFAVPTDTTIPAGTHSLVTISFDTFATSAANTTVTFGDQPVIREVSDTNADTLPVDFIDGFVTFSQGYEADVVSRPTGNGSVTVADVTQVGRFAAGLDAFDETHNEFQRADSAPRATLGNGAVSVADYTQAGRYAAALDTIAIAGGPGVPSLLSDGKYELFPIRRSDALLGLASSVAVVSTQAGPGSPITVAITTTAQGIENGIGFTLEFDPAVLQNPVVAKGADAQTATLFPNTLTDGKVGVILAFPVGTAIPAGSREVITVTFNVASNAPAGATPLTFSDAPVVREVSDVNANVIESTFTGGTVTVLAPTSAPVTVAGRVLRTNGLGISGAILTAVDQEGNVLRSRTNGFGYFIFDSVPSGQSYVITVNHKQFTFAPQIVNVDDNVLDLTFQHNP